MKWLARDDDDLVVVLPLDGPHEEHSEFCPCSPRLDVAGARPLLIHNRLATARPDALNEAMRAVREASP